MLHRASSLSIAFVIILSWLAPAALAEPNTPEPIPAAPTVLSVETLPESTVSPEARSDESARSPVPIPGSATTSEGGPDDVPAAPDAWGIWAPNLMDYGNGNAEDGAGATDTSSTVAIPKWTVEQAGMTAVRYGITGMPTAAQNTCGNPGLNLFAGGPNNSLSSIGRDWLPTYQSELTDIDTGLATYVIAGCFGGWSTDGDKAWLDVSFIDGTGTLLGTDTVGNVTAADRGSQTKLVYRAKSGRVPAGTRTIHVKLSSQRVAGSYNDGYADNLRLSLRRPLYVYLPLLTRPASPPAAPVNLTCSVASSSQINLQWQDASNNEDGFRIERAIGSGSFTEIRTTGAGVAQAQITGLTANTDYRFRVRAYNASGTSAYSNICSGHTPLPQPSTLRVVNNTMYPIIYVTIDAQAVIATEGQALLSNQYIDLTVSVGQHSYLIENGFWNLNKDPHQPVSYYSWSGTWQQPSGQLYTLTVYDPSIQQILTNFGTKAAWDVIPCNSGGCKYCFYNNGGFYFWYTSMGFGTPSWSTQGTYALDHRSNGFTYFKLYPASGPNGTTPYDGWYTEPAAGQVTISGPTSAYSTYYGLDSTTSCPAWAGTAAPVPPLAQ